jgi:hypothetical protein
MNQPADMDPTAKDLKIWIRARESTVMQAKEGSRERRQAQSESDHYVRMLSKLEDC